MQNIWLIPALPLMGFLLNGLFGKRLGKFFVSLVGSGSVLAAFLISLERFLLIASGEKEVIRDFVYEWIQVGSVKIQMSFQIDVLSGLMILIVTGVGFLIHMYSIGYMKEDEGYHRFFSYLNLFIFFMLLLVLGDNFIVMFLGWEGVGLCSYLLIGFYVDKKSAGDAANKAFVVNRIGDFGFIAAMLMIMFTFGSLSFDEVNRQSMNRKNVTASAQVAQLGSAANPNAGFWEKSNHFLKTGTDSAEMVTLITLLLFMGACGKSAQIPLYVWLPDAMEGPTPVSALIHAATMVTSGIYMVARLSHLFVLSETTMTVIAYTGAVTALFAATIGLVQTDIKKVLAYSTVSQLGYMFMALGVGAFSAGVFHLMTHAFFKALLFLGAGSVIIALHHEQDVKKMGDLRSKIPVTWFTFSIGSWALAGLPLGAGFFSKDEILWKVFSTGSVDLWVIGFLTAGCTAFYIYRLVNLTFYGQSRIDAHTAEHIKESPWTMLLPLIVLAGLSAFGGFLGVPQIFESFGYFPNILENYFHGFFAKMPVAADAHVDTAMEWSLMAASVILAFAGLFVAQSMYAKKEALTERLAIKSRTIYKLLLNKYYVDEVYRNFILNPVHWISNKILYRLFDTALLDGAINFSAKLIGGLGDVLKKSQTGYLQHYGVTMLVAVVVILSLFFKFV